jgi:DNA-binding MarR family transcriptional regulator
MNKNVKRVILTLTEQGLSKFRSVPAYKHKLYSSQCDKLIVGSNILHLGHFAFSELKRVVEYDSENMSVTELTLTPLETKVMKKFIEELYAEPGYSDVDAKDISEKIGEDIKQVRGAISSLVKKGFVDIDENEHNILYLHPQWWCLHPVWYQEVGYYIEL